MLMDKDTFTSLELVDLINQYRQQEGVGFYFHAIGKWK